MRAGAAVRETQDEPTRRDSILARAADLFATKGIAATSVRDIAEATGLLAGSLYHHFESKDALVDAILSRSLEKLLTSCRRVRESHSDPEACLESLIRASFRIMQDEPSATTIYLKDRELLIRLPRFRYLEDARAEIDTIWLDVIREGIEQGRLRHDLDPVLFYRYAAAALWSSAAWHSASGHSIEELTESYLSIFMEAVTVRAKRGGRQSSSAGGEGRRSNRHAAR